MSTRTIEVVCKCPICYRTYRQRCEGRWIGQTWRPRGYEHALRALCEAAGQGLGQGAWAGLAYCSECSARQCPPSLREAVEKWTKEGEIL